MKATMLSMHEAHHGDVEVRTVIAALVQAADVSAADLRQEVKPKLH